MQDRPLHNIGPLSLKIRINEFANHATRPRRLAPQSPAVDVSPDTTSIICEFNAYDAMMHITPSRWLGYGLLLHAINASGSQGLVECERGPLNLKDSG